ncbi:hypothetical protein B566_EDAN002329 [Ephemera danica]|nr:hypothetical protein B566_EDAN002329 [Ephemera danica]
MNRTVLCGVLLAIVFNNLVPLVSGLKCYACVQSGTEDRRCEKDPATFPNSVISCNKKYCVTRRIEYVDQEGEVFSFYRGCEQEPDFINEDITDSQFITYYRSCTTDLCNSGDGKDNSGGGSNGGNIDSDGSGDNSAIMVPGLGNAGTALNALPHFIAAMVLYVLLK